jgi:hypothetical protein
MEKLKIKQSIVITSIFQPSEAVIKFASHPDCELIVVGDKKTPQGWECKGVRYLSVEGQNTMPFTLSKVMPYNHYCRKMMGYLDAIARGADIIVDTDDDNIPKDDWGFPSFDGFFDCVSGHSGFVNIYQLFTSKKIWPRGLPLHLITNDFALEASLTSGNARVGVWQGLADEDPDVDAIYRLTDDSPTYFDSRDPVVLQTRVVTPFNSQNTQFRKECFPLLYLPTYVTFRFTDILRGLVAQPIMWAAGFQLGFLKATVIQKRNPHNYMRDFESEVPMYLHGEAVIDIVAGSISPKNSIAENLLLAYEALLSNRIVVEEEISNLKCWLQDVSELL